jgi:hypothetical protein
MLAERYQIAHTTIQFEHAGCALDDPRCVPDEQDLTPVGASERRSV